MGLLAYRGKSPSVAEGAYVAPGAVLIGDVRLAEGASVWFNAVLRADYEPITVGRNSNIQDGAVVHIDKGVPTVIGENVTVGHGAVVHGATVGDGALIGMNSTLLSGARIGARCVVAAGAVVPENVVFGDEELIVGVPAKSIGSVKPAVLEWMKSNCEGYVRLGAEYRSKVGNWRE